jgi:hypothetical protein
MDRVKPITAGSAPADEIVVDPAPGGPRKKA